MTTRNTGHSSTGSGDVTDERRYFDLQASHTIPNGECQAQPVVVPAATAPIAMDPLLTKFQVSDLLDESFEVLEKWRKRPGRGPEFIRYPTGEVRYRLSAVMKFIEEHTVRH